MLVELKLFIRLEGGAGLLDNFNVGNDAFLPRDKVVRLTSIVVGGGNTRYGFSTNPGDLDFFLLSYGSVNSTEFS